MLYQVWCLYHSYVRKAIKVTILWHHSGPLGSSSSHSSYFFRGARPSFSVRCAALVFSMLGFDWSYISLSFPTRWSPFSSWCGGTCRNWYLSFPTCITGYLCVVTWGRLITCLAFWKSSSAIISPNAVFFGGPTSRAIIYFTFNRCSFGYRANTSSLLCRSSNKKLGC